jgi:hypothetical protein
MLNVDKSKVSIPFSANSVVVDYVDKLEALATKQLYNGKVDGKKTTKTEKNDLIIRGNNSKGRCLEYNYDFPLLRELNETLDEVQKSNLKTILRIIQVAVDKITQTHEDKITVTIDTNKNEISKEDLIRITLSLRNLDWSNTEIERFITQNMGIEKSELIKHVIYEAKN